MTGVVVSAGNPRAIIYSFALVERILARVCDGESLAKICKEPDMPPRGTLHGWIMDRPEVQKAYDRAMSIRAHLLADEVIDLSDERNFIEVNATDFKGNPVVQRVAAPITSEFVSHQKLRVDSRKWTTSKLLPRVYGEKLALGGADDLPPIKSVSANINPDAAYSAMISANTKLVDDSPEEFM